MIDIIKCNILGLSLHKVGNKYENEGIQFSKSEMNIENVNTRVLLLKFFTSPFKVDEYYSFHHETELKYNEVYSFVSNIFENPEALYDNSVNIAKHLYEQSIHPKIKGGEFYVVYFKDCIIDNLTVDVIGLFKSENKDTFLKIYPKNDNFEIEPQQGININKLDKGCLIFNINRESGYKVLTVDNINKGSEIAHYWADQFLHIKPCKDEFYYTENIISLCKNFTAENPNIDKVKKAEILNKAVSFLRDNESFDIDDFSNQILKEEYMKNAFQAYKSQYEKDRDVIIVDDFSISEQALKKQSRTIKNTLRLDNNFKISIDGDVRYMEKGFDEEKGLNYYKLYFRNED